MKGLVRFTKTEPDLFWAMINPRYDILPLVRRHLEKRYADQSWIIFDTVRNYGLYFDKQKTKEMRSYSGPFPRDFEASDADEETCRQLWKTYFIAVNITERNNPRLHLRQLPSDTGSTCRRRAEAATWFFPPTCGDADLKDLRRCCRPVEPVLAGTSAAGLRFVCDLPQNHSIRCVMRSADGRHDFSGQS